MLNKKNITVFHAAPPNEKMSLCIFQFTVDMASCYDKTLPVFKSIWEKCNVRQYNKLNMLNKDC